MESFCLICSKQTPHSFWIRRKTIASSRELYGAAPGIPGTQDLVKCRECEFVSEINRPSNEDISEGYKNSKNEIHDSQFSLRVLSFENALKRIRKVLPEPPARILDIGCAGGAFLIAAENCGYIAKGLEPSRDLVEQAMQSRKLEVYQGLAEEAGLLFKEKFDIVSLWDVLEHVIDPLNTLEVATSLIKENGILILNVPDIGTGMARIAGKKNWWISSVHLYHFNEFHLTKLLQRFDFSLIFKRRYFQVLEFGYLIDIAVQMGIPGSLLFRNHLPGILKKLRIKYYASQTTFVFARK